MQVMSPGLVQMSCKYMWSLFDPSISTTYISPHDEYRSSGPKPIKLYTHQSIFQFFFKELHKNRFKNLIRTNKFKFSCQRVHVVVLKMTNLREVQRQKYVDTNINTVK
jgi:hypothetical protein